MTLSTTPSEADIRDRAYFLWEADGRPLGRDAEYWDRAVAWFSETAAEAATAPPSELVEAVDMTRSSGKFRGGAVTSPKTKTEPRAKAPPRPRSEATRARPVRPTAGGKTA